MSWPAREAEFEAEITIFPLGPDTRLAPARNGIRWGFAYAEDHENGERAQADIWPEFVDDNGQRLSDSVPLFGVLKARMHMVTTDWSRPYTQHIKVGTKFLMMDGSRPVASGVVTALFRPERVR